MKNKGQAKKGTMKRLIRMLFEFYPVLLPLVLVCIILNALISSIPAIFQQNIIAVVEQYWQTKDWAAALGQGAPGKRSWKQTDATSRSELQS